MTVLKNIKLSKVRIYSYLVNDFQKTPIYFISFFTNKDVESILKPLGINPTEKGFYIAKSETLVRVTSAIGDYDTLLKAIQIADARNIPRDLLFAEIEADIKISVSEYHTPRSTKMQLSIEDIMIKDAEMLLIKAMKL